MTSFLLSLVLCSSRSCFPWLSGRFQDISLFCIWDSIWWILYMAVYIGNSNCSVEWISHPDTLKDQASSLKEALNQKETLWTLVDTCVWTLDTLYIYHMSNSQIFFLSKVKCVKISLQNIYLMNLSGEYISYKKCRCEFNGKGAWVISTSFTSYFSSIPFGSCLL